MKALFSELQRKTFLLRVACTGLLSVKRTSETANYRDCKSYLYIPIYKCTILQYSNDLALICPRYVELYLVEGLAATVLVKLLSFKCMAIGKCFK